MSATRMSALALALAVLSIAAALLASDAAVAPPAAVAAAAPHRPASEAAAEEANNGGDSDSSSSSLLPLEYFPLMQPFQRCLFVCRYCYQHHTVRLLHCANDWCLGRVQKSRHLPARAYQECPDMRMIGGLEP